MKRSFFGKPLELEPYVPERVGPFEVEVFGDAKSPNIQVRLRHGFAITASASELAVCERSASEFAASVLAVVDPGHRERTAFYQERLLDVAVALDPGATEVAYDEIAGRVAELKRELEIATLALCEAAVIIERLGERASEPPELEGEEADPIF